MSTERTRAIILRRTNYGEADRVLTLLTPLGQRSAMAKSVRREKSRLAGGIELFAISDVVLTASRSNMSILTSARLVHFYHHIVEDYDRLQFGYEVTSLVLKANEQIDDSGWYDVLSEVYMGLDSVGIPLQLTQCWFYLHYAELTGYAFNLERDMLGQQLKVDKNYSYDIHEKGLRPSDQGIITANHIKLLRLMANKSIAVIAQIGGVEEILSDCWLVTRQHASF